MVGAKKHMIYFEIDGQGYAVDAAELAGVASACPFVTYPGLPEKVVAIVQWSGRVFPVVDAFGAQKVNFESSTVLFSNEGLKGSFSEIAVPVPGQVRVYFPENSAPAPSEALPIVVAVLHDSEGHEAYQVSLARIAEFVPKPNPNLKTRGGKKIAA